MYKEDISMMNEEVLMKDPSFTKVRKVIIAGGLVLFAPNGEAMEISRYELVNETHTELRLDATPDTKIVEQQEVQLSNRLPEDIENKLDDIANLEQGWDGYHASAIDGVVVRNAHSFIASMISEGFEAVLADDVYPTPYGTIVVEYTNDNGLVSMEISATQVGYFTDYPGCGNYGSRGSNTDFKSIPDELKRQLQA